MHVSGKNFAGLLILCIVQIVLSLACASLCESREFSFSAKGLTARECSFKLASEARLMSGEDPAAAVFLYEKAISYDPDNASLYIGLGDGKFQLKDWQGAEAAYLNAISRLKSSMNEKLKVQKIKKAKKIRALF